MSVLAETESGLQQSLTLGTHRGVQLSVRHGSTRVDLAVGEAAPGRPMAEDTVLPWFSTTKVLSSVAFAIAWERGVFDLDDRVAAHIPEFDSRGKGQVTIRHLWTHTAGLRRADAGVAGKVPMREHIAHLCNAPLDDDWTPGARAGYHGHSSFALLSEIVRRADQRDFDRFVHDEVVDPLALTDTWLAIPADAYADNVERIGLTTTTPDDRPVVSGPGDAGRLLPGAGAWGSARDLAAVLEVLAGRGTRDRTRLLRPQTVEAMTARQRVGLLDEGHNLPIDWGLGLALDYWAFGNHSTKRTYGHGGAQSSVGYVDPETGLVVAIIYNGVCSLGLHILRLHQVLDTVHDELGLANMRTERPLPPAVAAALRPPA